MVLELKCIHKYRRRSGAIYRYRLIDRIGKIYEPASEELKKAIKVGIVKVVNLKLTSDNRIIEDKFAPPIEKTKNRAIITKKKHTNKSLIRKRGTAMNDLEKYRSSNLAVLPKSVKFIQKFNNPHHANYFYAFILHFWFLYQKKLLQSLPCLKRAQKYT